MIALSKTRSFATQLTCSNCGVEYSLYALNNFSTCCNAPLLVNYDTWPPAFHKADLLFRQKNMWRYFEMLPVLDEENIVSLGEGFTPIISLQKSADKYNFTDILLKDESFAPTGSFKARGLSMAVSKAKELGVQKCIIPTAGNAGGALAAYCAKAGIACTVVMPAHTPNIFKQECALFGAQLILIDGLINDCAKKVAQLNSAGNFFDVSTFKEPYRVEGKKTMGYEIAEQFNWQLPDVIIYPAGGGTGLVGIWKAFKEMKMLGWVKGPLPKMIVVQSINCAPVVRAFYNRKNWKDNFTPSPTLANGLAVPYPFAMQLMLNVLDESNGFAIAVSDEAIIKGVKEVAREEGVLLAPEGAATWVAMHALQKQNIINGNNKILLINTGSGYKYMENIF
jgi:threonine synthase